MASRGMSPPLCRLQYEYAKGGQEHGDGKVSASLTLGPFCSPCMASPNGHMVFMVLAGNPS